MKLVIVEDSQIIRLDCRQMLELAGFEVLGEGSDGLDAINLCKWLHPDVALLDIEMPNLDGISAARQILADKSCHAIVFLTAYFEDKLIREAMELGAFGYLVKPLDEKTLVSTIQVAYAKSLESKDLEERLDELAQKLEDRKVIERAKGLLMKRDGIDEDAAYSLLRTLSMEKRCSIRRIADLLITGLEGARPESARPESARPEGRREGSRQ
ncbi:MAG: response regulator [Coriobacteriales bacterium]|nr:response regulator [Coriobacteriales bacterium]